MTKETDEIRPNGLPARPLDAVDRRLLGTLVDDATVSYAELGNRAHLSAPAAHERVKRLRQSGVIRGTSAMLEPKAVGKPLLAFVHVDTQGWGKTPDLMEIQRFPEVEEICATATAVQNIYLSVCAYGVGGYWTTGGITYNEKAKPFFELGASLTIEDV